MNARRTLASILAARAAFGLAFLLAMSGAWASPWYFPLERRWAFVRPPSGLAMGWFGACAIALGAAAIASATVWLVTKRGPLARLVARPRTLLALAIAAGSTMLVDVAFVTARFVEAATREPAVSYLPGSP